MKKIVLGIALISLTSITSCKKESKTALNQAETSQTNIVAENILAKELNMSLENNHLVFKTTADYQKIVDNPTKEISDKLTLAINHYVDFKSYAEYKTENKISNEVDLFNDPYFESMLNVDKIIQIGDYLYRVNPKTEKVYVLSIKFNAEYQDLVNENISNTNIKVYSTSDNVLELVENNIASKSTALFCSEGGIGWKADLAKFSSGTGVNNVEALAAFNKYGIYYSLFATIKPSVGSSQFKFNFNGSVGYIHYHVRCGATVDYATISTGNANASAEQRYQSWQGSTNLNNLFFGFTVQDNTTTALLSRMVVIRQYW